MAFRTVVIKNKCKLEYSLNYLICRGEEDKRILIDEIEFLIIQNTSVAITCALLSALIDKKVKVIFCDTKNNPQAELVPYYNNFSTSKRITTQINFNNDFKGKLWAKIIYEKINNEAKLLKFLKNSNYIKLEKYLSEIEADDTTNREGHAAKVYFNSLFGNTFSRDDNSDINKFLNYGYSIIVSSINREIKMLGYLTELGIHHKGETNSFNLSYDFFEPLRSLIDYFVITGKVDNENYKDFFIKILNHSVSYNGKSMLLNNAIHLYVQSLFTSLIDEDLNEVVFIKYEF